MLTPEEERFIAGYFNHTLTELDIKARNIIAKLRRPDPLADAVVDAAKFLLDSDCDEAWTDLQAAIAAYEQAQKEK